MPVSISSEDDSPTRTGRQSQVADHASRPVKKTVIVPANGNDPPSPFKPTFSFNDRGQAGSDLIDERRFKGRGVPGDAALVAASNRSPEESLQASRKSSFYGEVFAYRESHTSIRDRIARESVVMAEVTTNVKIHDEYGFMTDFSRYLSLRYSRPESLIMVNVGHSACMLFGGTFDPAYKITVTALPSQIQPTTNKRNAALIQTFMTDELRVPANRGVIKFIAIAEENLATNGHTVLGEIEALDRHINEEGGSRKGSMAWPKHPNRKKSSAGLSVQSETRRKSHVRTPTPTHAEQRKKSHAGSFISSQTLPEGREVTSGQWDEPIHSPAIPQDERAEKAQKISKRRSILSLFGK